MVCNETELSFAFSMSNDAASSHIPVLEDQSSFHFTKASSWHDSCLSWGGIDSVDSDDDCNMVEESLSILLNDEAENSHIFGEQSQRTTITDTCQSLQSRSTSVQSSKPSNKSAWHGSCASFLGNDSELLNLSMSLDELNESRTRMYLTLSNDFTLNNSTPTSTSACTKTNETIESGPTASCSLRKITRMNSESRFKSSSLITECSDRFPRKPKRNDDYDINSDENDTGFRNSAAENAYEVICTVLSETISVIDELFEASDTTISHEESISEDGVKKHPASNDANLQKARPNKAHSEAMEDTTPKCPTRQLSPLPPQKAAVRFVPDEEIGTLSSLDC